MEEAGLAAAEALNDLSMEELLRAASSTHGMPEWGEDTLTENLSSAMAGETKSNSVQGGFKYTLIPGCDGVRETMEWNMAAMQFVKLTGKPVASVTKVDVYECPSVEAKFNSTKREFAAKGESNMKEKWVFHGTKTEATVTLIMTGGFKVGGEEGVPIVNGAAWGRGVYTATGASTPISYAGGTKQVILARGLLGTVGQQGVTDSWKPKQDWIIFRRGGQLLPRYVVHYN
jgi:hypothetical protein